jgi:SAM-dependent methyltransferase
MSNPGGHSLHPLVEGFADAAVYDMGRPRYGAEVVQAITEALGTAPGAPVLELGAGTGQLSVALMAAGFELSAVEPLAETRAMLAGAIGAERVHAGVAEAIPLPDGSVDAVVAADSFHWFDHTRALPEIRRVLRPGGGVAILRSLPRFQRPWGHDLGGLLAQARPLHPAYDGEGPAFALSEHGGYGPVREITLTSHQASDRRRLLAYVASVSWIGALGGSDRAALLARAEEILEQHQVGELTLQIDHHIWAARLR